MIALLLTFPTQSQIRPLERKGIPMNMALSLGRIRR